MRMIFAAAMAASLSAGTAQASTIADLYSSFISFGDSLTDDGKFGALAPPSLEGRFSNGITYAEHIAGLFEADGKFTANYALGGATAELDNETAYPPNPAILSVSTFAAQIGTFAFLEPFLPTGDNPLVSVLFGANDIFQDLGEGGFVGEIGTAAADAVSFGIAAISLIDAKYDDFLVINLPDMSILPRYAGDPAAAAEAGAEAAAFNARLAQNLDILDDVLGLNIIEVDLAAFLNDLLLNADELGITNVTDACTASFTEFSFQNCSFTGDGFDISLADAFLFADASHPNGVAHAAFAQAIRAQVPLPAGLPLLLAGLGALTLVRRRRA